ncbi:MAG: DUF3365 domain-containing protein [Pseudomonadales bacterium]|nr:DUF3365 domain-containing protein [Pseudomonadales bacterium]MCP5183930.1 DUF3365 domain-containing protein [Pseudomonadales bacterium]
MSGVRLTGLLTLVPALCCVSGLAAEPGSSETRLHAQAAGVAERFAGTLKPELQQALVSGGAVVAVAVCATRAPAIARELSETTGWQVRRVSLKPRNRELATPDAWEAEQLAALARRQAVNDGSDTLTATAQVDGRFRFMKAQVTEPLCLTCHGTQVAHEVAAVLRAYYPDDAAMGYAAGQVRGAISVSRSLP